MNWFLYIAKEGFFMPGENTQRFIKPGFGVGKCELRPGILDAPHGTMLVVPGDYIFSKIKWRGRNSDVTTWPNCVADSVRKLILAYYY